MNFQKIAGVFSKMGSAVGYVTKASAVLKKVYAFFLCLHVACEAWKEEWHKHFDQDVKVLSDAQ